MIKNIVRVFILQLRLSFLRTYYGMDIAESARLSLGARLDKTWPKGIHVGKDTFIATGALILTHDFSRGVHTDTYIGEKCFIGVNAIVMPGIRIGDEVIVGAGSVVTRDLPNNVIAVGNPAKIIKRNVQTKRFGQIKLNCNNSEQSSS